VTLCDSDRAWLFQHQHPEEAATMTQYVGLDVSMKETKLHVLDDAGKRGVWRAAAPLNPPRLLPQFVGMLPLRLVLGSRLDH
jgi:hypothetical protein